MSTNLDVRKKHRVTIRQLDLLYDFLMANRDVATSLNRTLQAKEYAKTKWSEIAEVLNAQGDGAYKSWTNWCKYWVDYKAKIKRRAAVRASQTGGGPFAERPITDTEKKFLLILGEDFGQGMPAVQVTLPAETNTAPSIKIETPDSPENSPSENVIVQPYLDSSPQDSHQDQEMAQDSLPHSPNKTPTLSVSPSPATSIRSPRRRRRRHDPRMSQVAARRALVRSAQIHADAAVRTSEAMQSMVATLMRIESVLSTAFLAKAEQDHNE